MKTTVLFDLDGTLLNTLEDLADAVNHALSEHGYPLRTLDEIRQFVGNGVKNLMARALPEGPGNPDFDKCFVSFVDYYAIHNRDKTDLYTGIKELIKDLYEAGFKMAIVTNKLQAASEVLVSDFFAPYITVVVGDAPGRQKKPHPDGVNEALKILGVTDKSEVIYVGDSDVDAKTAINSELDYVLCLWGFRTKEQLADYEPLAFIENPEELKKLLLS